MKQHCSHWADCLDLFHYFCFEFAGGCRGIFPGLFRSFHSWNWTGNRRICQHKLQSKIYHIRPFRHQLAQLPDLLQLCDKIIALISARIPLLSDYVVKLSIKVELVRQQALGDGSPEKDTDIILSAVRKDVLLGGPVQ